MNRTERFQQILDQVLGRLEQESWFQIADNYVIEINEHDRPIKGNSIILANTHRGGHLPTKITYYVRNIHNPSFKELYRITKHEFAHLWGLDEKDAQSLEP